MEVSLVEAVLIFFGIFFLEGGRHLSQSSRIAVCELQHCLLAALPRVRFAGREHR